MVQLRLTGRSLVLQVWVINQYNLLRCWPLPDVLQHCADWLLNQNSTPSIHMQQAEREGRHTGHWDFFCNIILYNPQNYSERHFVQKRHHFSHIAYKCLRWELGDNFTKWSRQNDILTAGPEMDRLEGSEGSAEHHLTHSCRQWTPPAWRKFSLSLLIHTLPWPYLSFIKFSCNPVPLLFCDSALIMIVVFSFSRRITLHWNVACQMSQHNSLVNFVLSVVCGSSIFTHLSPSVSLFVLDVFSF